MPNVRSIFELLQDTDGDGLNDGLRGKLYLPKNSDTATLRAASEVVARLSSRAVCLQPEFAVWKLEHHGFYIGRYPPRRLGRVQGFEVLFRPHGVAFLARSGEELLRGANLLATWPPLITETNLEEFRLLDTTLRRLLWREDGLRLEFGRKLTQEDVAKLPRVGGFSLSEGRLLLSPTAVPTPPNTKPRFSNTFSLATALQGGGLYTGTPDFPETLRGTLAIQRPIKEAVSIAARLATEGLTTRLPVTSDSAQAEVKLLLDDTLPDGVAEIRVSKKRDGARLELAGKDDAALANAATFFATTFPELPDGTHLHELVANLENVLQDHTRLGRLASVAVQTRPRDAVRALLANPPAFSPKLLGTPVRNSARDGVRSTWQATFPWEGKRFLEAVAAADVGSHRQVQLAAFLSESREVRERLALQARKRLAARGITCEPIVYCAFKPGFHWLCETVGPRARREGAARVVVTCAPHSQGVEVADRWLRELYPAAEVLETQLGLAVEVRLEDAQTVPYRASAFSRAGERLWEIALEPPTLEISCLGRPGTHAFPTTGWLSLAAANKTLLDQHLPTDRDLVWAWYTGQVLPELTGALDTFREPLFSDLSIALAISEPDEYTGVDHEFCSAVEAMHEEFYFGTLEAFSSLRGENIRERLSTPGWILPFCRARPEEDTNIQVSLTAPGTHRLGWEDARGRFFAAPGQPIKVTADVLRLSAGSAPRLHLNVVAQSAKAATHARDKLTWLIQHQTSLGNDSPFPADVQLELTCQSPRKTLLPLHVEAETLPKTHRPDLEHDAPLSPQDVVAVARDWSRRSKVHLRPLKETRRGNPLVCLEFGATPGLSRARAARWKPSVLISARQHANEPTSTPADFMWLEQTLDTALLRSFNIVFHPLENPDGARLYGALRQLVGHHMHHAARYTSLGSDIQATPPVEGQLIAERQLHAEAENRWSPLLHLNNHGYPAHEWTRPHSGYVPLHFEDWSLPFGYLSILIAEPEATGLLELSRKRIAASLADAGLESFTAVQVHRNLRYRSEPNLPFTFERAFPFLVRVRDPQDANPTLNTGTIPFTLISEVPDETVDGDLWRGCVLAHQTMNRAVLEAVAECLELSFSESVRHENGTIFTYIRGTKLRSIST